MRSRTTAYAAAVVGLIALAAPGLAFAQDEMAEVEIRSEHAAGNVHALFGRGGNIGVLVTPEGHVLVDDQFAPLTERIVAAVQAIEDAPIRFLINTHYHGDHTGGNENLGAAGTTIMAHDNVRKRLAANPERGEGALPVVTFSEALSVHLGEEARAHHVHNAHTDGDSVIHFTESNVIHTGDLFFNGRYPYIDVEAGGNLLGLIEAAEKILEVADAETVIIPGHGPLAGEVEVQQYRAMLETARDRVGALMEEGKSLEEIIADRPMAEYDEEWGGAFIGPERFLRLVHASLEQRR